MKKLLSSTLLVIITILVSQSTVFAQEGPTKLGLGVVYGSEPDAAGIQINATFRVSPQVAIAPDVTVYFPDEHDFPHYKSYFGVNLNGHYIFDADVDHHFYLLGGLNVSTADYEGPADSNSELGINLGAGGEYHLEKLSLFSELKYIVSDYDQVVIAAGIRIPVH